MDYVGQYQIKINRAEHLAKIGACPQSFDAMLEHVSGDLIGSVTSRELAAIIDALWCCAGKSKCLAEREALENGGIWSDRDQRFLGVA